MSLLSLMLLTAVVPSWAQVDKVTAYTTGISCGTCAAVAEIYLRRLAGVGKVAMSMSRETVEVAYKPGASFQPWDIRRALDKADVGVIRFDISARGRVQEQGRKLFFVADKDKFLLVDSPKIPSAVAVSIEGGVNDSAEPLQLKVTAFKPLRQ